MLFKKRNITLQKQKTNKMMADFENTQLLTELKVVVSLLEKENLDLRNPVINKYLVMQKIEPVKIQQL